MRKPREVLILVILPLILFAGFLYLLPPIRERVDWRLDQIRLQVRYMLFPPEEAVFVPQDQVNAIVQQTMLALTPTITPVIPTPSRTPGPTNSPQPTATPTLTPTAIPSSVSIKGVRYVDQHGAFNYCAPANMAMALSFWGWQGSRADAGQVLKPFDRDLNVMPYEMVDFVTSHTNFKALWRSGGTLEMLKTLLAAGYPVMVEKGAYMQDLSGKVSWMGHYQVLTGYNDGEQLFIAQDSFYRPNFPVNYAEMVTGLRSFNGVFLLVYPAEKETDIMALLGPYQDQNEAEQIAMKTAEKEKDSLTGIDQYFAWFNRGSSQVHLQDFSGAAASYDQAFKLYELLPKDTRPWRMLWYQTGPYFAYYYAGRYQDVIDLASLTIKTASNPYLEESFYWRGMSELVVGKQNEAIADFRTALEYHPGFPPAQEQLVRLGLVP